MKGKQMFAAVLVVAALALAQGLFASGQGEPAPAAAAAAGGTLTIGVDQEAVGLDPNIVTAFSSFVRLDVMYNRLVRLDDKLQIVPDLAESWEIPNNLTYLFHLRHGVKFHNGRELTADDVKYSLERILDPKTASPGRSYIDVIKQIDVVDPSTVKLTLSSPLASLLAGLASTNCAIVPKEDVQQFGNLQRNVDGTGPFKLADWVPDNSMTLVKNPSYFEPGKPYLEKVIFRVIPEQTSLLAGVKAGTLDMATLSDGSLILQAKKDPSLVVMQTPGINLRIFSFNTARKPFDDVRVRQAIAMAIDRNEIIATAEMGLAQPSGPIPSSSGQWALPISQLPFSTPDLAKAKDLLAQAGYPNGFTFGIVASPTYEGGLAVAQVVQSELKKIGLNPEIQSVEWGTYIDKWVKRDFDTMVELRGGSPEPDRFLYRTFYSKGGVNNFQFKDREVDDLLDQGRQLTTFAERKPVYDKLQVLLTQDAPAVFLYVPVQTQIVKPYVKGFKVMGNASLLYLADTKVEK